MAFRAYYQLSKPGIIYGNLLTAIAGYVYGVGASFDVKTFLGLCVGMSLTIAGACAANNVLDRGIDARMKRTSKRGLVSGDILPRNAAIYSIVATDVGLALTSLTQNFITTLLIAFAWFAYVVLYGYAKRHTVHGTLVGCLSGSMPLVAGYTAASNQLDMVALQLFLLMTAWQMAHFYGIALYRKSDYASAGLPMMPVVYGSRTTKIQTVLYIIAFVAVVGWMFASASLTLISTFIIIIASMYWLARSLADYSRLQPEVWGRRVFLLSLTTLLCLSAVLVANPWLPL